jgi:tetratricopeptide (TPR) repeat protein
MRFVGAASRVAFVVVWIAGARAASAAAGTPAPAVVPPATDAQLAEARQHHAAGSKLYDLAEYEAALREFKEAYRAVEDPAFLFNIAQCHRKLGHAPDAITFYRNYLRRAPRAANRAEVERHIAELERAPAPAPAPAAETTATPPTAPAPTAPTPALAPSVPPPAPAGDGAPTLIAAPASAPPPAEQPFYKRGWFWIAAGAVVAGTATTLIVLHGRSQQGPFCPDCAGTTAITP